MSTKWVVCDYQQTKQCKKLGFSYELYRDWCHSLIGTSPVGQTRRCNPVSRKAYNKIH